MIGQSVKFIFLICGNLLVVEVGVGHVLPGLGVDVRDGVHLLGVVNNKVVITSMIRESEIIMSCKTQSLPCLVTLTYLLDYCHC